MANASNTSLAFGNVKAAEPMLPSWVLPFFAATASSDVEFLNYLIAIYPLLIFGAGRRKGWTEQTRSSRPSRRPACSRSHIRSEDEES